MWLSTVPPSAIELIIRQQPRDALVVAKGKERARKSVDSPPMVELRVKRTVDPQQQFLQNLHLTMVVSLYKADKDEPLPGESLIGTLASSIHKIKDFNNQDAGFFIFGDISVRVLGTYRLHFSLFELRPDEMYIQHLSTITSEKFTVVAPKDFKGMEESTYLSRTVADQGVRLRLRKEARTAAGTKRSYPHDSPVNITPARPAPTYEGSYTPARNSVSYDGTFLNMYNTPSYQGSYHANPGMPTMSSMPNMTAMSPMTASHSMSTNPDMAAMATNHSINAMAPMATTPNLTTMATNPNMGIMSNTPNMYFQEDYDYGAHR
jgi:hypothetical protein